MLHQMKLWSDSFNSIREETKTIEMRLNDEKRKKIKIGDIIEFKNINTEETMKCVVLNLVSYPSFKELYEAYDKVSIGYKKEEVANYFDMYSYYSKKDILKYGALAIHICMKK